MRPLVHRLVLASLVAALAFGCRGAVFDPASKVEAVRILATRADKPYAKPGDTVNLEVLAFDGRRDKPAPMKVYWVPIPCVDPPGDSYYACYPGFARLPVGVDVGPLLTAGNTFSFTMPPDAITKHSKRSGAVDAVPNGLAVVFTIACGGHVEYVPPKVGGPVNAMPLGCFDANETQLGPDDFAFAFSLVYAFTDRQNQNPVVDALTFGGTKIDPGVGISLDHCGSAAADANGAVNRGGCPTTPMDVTVPDASWEDDPGSFDASGAPLKESLRVQYYTTDGKLQNDTINLFDPRSGRISPTTDDLTAPAVAGENVLWAVVRDNRGGTTWVTVPMHVR
jgi:hypothetical protein